MLFSLTDYFIDTEFFTAPKLIFPNDQHKAVDLLFFEFLITEKNCSAFVLSTVIKKIARDIPYHVRLNAPIGDILFLISRHLKLDDIDEEAKSLLIHYTCSDDYRENHTKKIVKI